MHIENLLDFGSQLNYTLVAKVDRMALFGSLKSQHHVLPSYGAVAGGLGYVLGDATQVNPGMLTVGIKRKPVSAKVDIGLESGLKSRYSLESTSWGGLQVVSAHEQFKRNAILTKCIRREPLWTTPEIKKRPLAKSSVEEVTSQITLPMSFRSPTCTLVMRAGWRVGKPKRVDSDMVK